MMTATIDPATLLAAAMRPHGLLGLQRDTGELSVRLAQQLQRLLNDPEAAQRWPREVRVLREGRDRRRAAREPVPVGDRASAALSGSWRMWA
jgi:hypothetical protein